MKSQLMIIPFLILLTACSTQAAPPQTPPATPLQPTPQLTAPEAAPTATPIEALPPVTLFQQNFETDPQSSTNDGFQLHTENNTNHILCNEDSAGYTAMYFGKDFWSDYAVELQVKALAYAQDPYVTVSARLDPSNQVGYYGALNFLTGSQNLAYNDPYEDLGTKNAVVTLNKWYTLRIEALESNISFYIDNQLIATGNNTQRTQGKAGFFASPHTQVCLDNIHIWALTETGFVENYLSADKISLEVVTDKADPNNAWGGHQARIVRTDDGVFTAFITSDGDPFNQKWHLVWRRDSNEWVTIAEGNAGDGPVNLLTSPDGTLHVVGWPEGIGTIWSGKPNLGSIQLSPTTIPGVMNGYWSYYAAGITTNGDICIFTSTGGEDPGGEFLWACYMAQSDTWSSHTTSLDYRHAYTYVFPQPNRQLSILSTRDVRWSALGYPQPPGAFDYVFNALGVWQTDDFTKNPLQRTYAVEEAPTEQFPAVFLDAQQDAYIDTFGQVHILYWVQGASTNGDFTSRHLILSAAGELLHDVLLPGNGQHEFARIFQDEAENFYLLHSSGMLYPAGKDGLTLGTPIPLDLKNNTVEYSGFALSVPRTGTVASNVMDVVFPSDGGTKWVYFQLQQNLLPP